MLGAIEDLTPLVKGTNMFTIGNKHVWQWRQTLNPKSSNLPLSQCKSLATSNLQLVSLGTCKQAEPNANHSPHAQSYNIYVQAHVFTINITTPT